MVSTNDYSRNSRFAADPGFEVVTRQGQVTPGPVFMPTPVRSATDHQVVAQARHLFRWDLLAYDTMGDVGLKWVLMRHNRVEDPFLGPLAGERYLIPTDLELAHYLGQG